MNHEPERHAIATLSSCALILLLVFTCSQAFAQKPNVLWYNKPATHFEEALVLGNGKTGATVFGGVLADQVYLNDATLWSGEPVDANINPEAYKHIPEIREALSKEDYRLADKLNKNIQGKFSESYAPLGTMTITFKQQGDYQNYRRELDISKATATVNYDLNNVHYTREYFVSHPDKAMVIRLSANKKGALNFRVSFKSLLKYSSSAVNNTLQVNGYAPYHVAPDYWREAQPVKFDENRGTRFSTYFKALNKGGQVTLSDSTLDVSNADEVVLFVSTATSFNGFDKDPAKNGLNNKALAKKQLDDAFKITYSVLKERHLKDYQSFFKRVNLSLDQNAVSNLPTDERLKSYGKGADDKNLEVLYFQYGRYLLISSSRVAGVPANLQGIWNPYIRPPWSSNYTMNINAEENYWMAESANLPEMHMPFLTFIGNLAKTGKNTAKNFYGINRGWAAAHNSDIWAMSNPVGEFGKGDPVWANWNMSGTWAVTHLWDHYLYTGDKTFLKNHAYPLMKGAALFCLDWLVKDKQGYLVTSPSTSPENVYLTPDGYKGATLYGSTADLAMIRECFKQTIKAAEDLNIDVTFRDSVKNALDKLYPYQVGKNGNLQEWYHDWKDPDPQHRHQSHLYGLYPGHQITPAETPQLAAAAKKTLEIRGDNTTGWSKGWRINLWARLNDGNHAYKMFRELLNYVEPDGAKNINYGGGGGTYPNLLDAHPPFQIDGNFGGAAGIIEMLLQSDDENVYLLPALPDKWQSGTVSGICARGGFELSIKWQNGKLMSAEILSKNGKKGRLHYNGKTLAINIKKGSRLKINADLVSARR
nr:glycoside hydrolase family 95 protein [uncultured Mucilaginibacter sp.]